MATFFQWLHVSAAVIGVGGLACILFVLLPASSKLNQEERELLFNGIRSRFRWITWSAIFVLIGSGIYNVKFVWQAPWGKYWEFLSIKLGLVAIFFLIVLCLTLPIKVLGPFREHRNRWLGIAFGLAMAVILISAYLRALERVSP